MVVNATGHCCGAGFTTIDVVGRCCASDAHVDACGVCGGDGVAVDVLRMCCKSTLPASGICCVDGAGQSLAVDDCGVCGGMNACDATVTLEVVLSVAADGALVTALLRVVATTLGVSTDSVALVTMVSRCTMRDKQCRRCHWHVRLSDDADCLWCAVCWACDRAD
jgi:hypothetical protein